MHRQRVATGKSNHFNTRENHIDNPSVTQAQILPISAEMDKAYERP